MKSKNAKNRKKNRRAKRNAPNKAQDVAAEIMEQRTLDSLDPVKNAPDTSLFVFDNNLPHKNKLIKNKTTTTDKKLAAGQLGIRLPKHTGKTIKEKRKLSETEKEVIERKAKRLRGDDTEATEKKEKQEDKEGDDVMEDEKPEQKPVVLVNSSKKAKKSDTPAKQVYDLWGDKPVVPVKPNESFIQEVLYPKQKEFVPKPIESKLPAVPVEAGHSYRPVAEDQERLQKQKKKMEDKLYAEGREGTKLLRKLGKYDNKTFFPRIDTGDDEKANGEEEGEEAEPIRMIPQKHKTAKDLKKMHKKNVARDARERAEEFARREQEVDNIPDFIADIEAKEKKREEKRLKRAGLISEQVNQPRSTDGKRVKQPVVTVIDKPTDRLRSLQAVVNPLKDRFLSMKNRGLISTYKAKKGPLPMYKTVERPDVREMIREDEEKYLKPVLDKLEKAQKQRE